MNLDRYFRTLGISDTKDIKSIKRAFMKVAKKYHPDKTQNNTNLQDRFKQARNAYENIIKFKKECK